MQALYQSKQLQKAINNTNVQIRRHTTHNSPCVCAISTCSSEHRIQGAKALIACTSRSSTVDKQTNNENSMTSIHNTETSNKRVTHQWPVPNCCCFSDPPVARHSHTHVAGTAQGCGFPRQGAALVGTVERNEPHCVLWCVLLLHVV